MQLFFHVAIIIYGAIFLNDSYQKNLLLGVFPWGHIMMNIFLFLGSFLVMIRGHYFASQLMVVCIFSVSVLYGKELFVRGMTSYDLFIFFLIRGIFVLLYYYSIKKLSVYFVGSDHE